VEAVCTKCWAVEWVPNGEAIPRWTDDDYYRNREAIEAKFGPEFAEVERQIREALSG
jgi:hypothetical protein